MIGVSIEAWIARARQVFRQRPSVDRRRNDQRIGNDELVVLVGDHREREIEDVVVDEQAVAPDGDTYETWIDVDPVTHLTVLKLIEFLVVVE